MSEVLRIGVRELRGNLTAYLRQVRDVPMHHRDPFDHLLIAQALVEDATFISSDRMVGRYSVRSMAFSA